MALGGGWAWLAASSGGSWPGHSDFLLCCSAKPLHHALVWLLGFRMAGFMLSGSGIREFVLGNMGLGWGGWGKIQVNDGGGWGCGRDGVWRGTGWWCILLIGGA